MQTTSPGRISSTGPPSRCAQPQPALTMRVCPSGCVCHAVRAPGSKVTLAPCTNAGSGAWKSGSMRAFPVNHSEGPFADGCDPARLISIFVLLLLMFLVIVGACPISCATSRQNDLSHHAFRFQWKDLRLK